VFSRLTHTLILEKLNDEALMDICKTENDVYAMLDVVTQEVKLAIDFTYELHRLDRFNLMDISIDKYEFMFNLCLVLCCYYDYMI